jgi:2-oxoglutarate dehydrogenase E2 component (dihydrolipoamide succinyltransferase)
MSIEVKIPAIGESITSGVLSVWHKKSGDIVKDGEPLFTLETDKISTEIPANGSGRLQIQIGTGEEVKIGQVVAVLDETTAEPPEVTPTKTSKSEPIVTSVATPAVTDTRNETLSPAARRLAKEEKIMISEVAGTGKRGQVTKSDLVNFLETRGTQSAPAEAKPAVKTPATSVPLSVASAADNSARTTRKKMSPLRKKIATHLVTAQQNAAMLTTFNECDMTAIMQLRARYQENFQRRHSVKLGFMSFFIKAVVDALQTVPAMNAWIDGDDLVENHFYDIGVAVGTDRGLVVPVVRDADTKSLANLEKDVAEYAKGAHEGKLRLDDLTGGVFTITNGGIYGSLLSTPILNPPQSGILGMHKIQNRPVAIESRIEVRPMMYLAVSYDHRVVDGKEAVTFLVRVKECIEDPSRLLLQG